jgi:hypothetical protein
MIADERAALVLAGLSSTLAPIFRGRLCEILLATRKVERRRAKRRHHKVAKKDLTAAKQKGATSIP